jgi:hypothetical protein
MVRHSVFGVRDHALCLLVTYAVGVDAAARCGPYFGVYVALRIYGGKGRPPVAPEGSALERHVGAPPCLLVVGVGNPTAALRMARLGARWGKSGSCDPRDQ